MRAPRILSYEECRTVARECESLSAAFKFLKTDFYLFKRYAMSYTDPETGKSFYQILCDKSPENVKTTYNGKADILTEAVLKRAIEKTQSNAEAAHYLKVDYRTFKKYASAIMTETGKSLYESNLRKNVPGMNMNLRKRTVLSRITKKILTTDILSNNRPNYPLALLKPKLIRFNFLEDKCACCGFDEERLIDGKKPLVLVFKNEEANYSLENLQILCYNCYFLTVGNLLGNRKVKLKDLKNEEKITDFDRQE